MGCDDRLGTKTGQTGLESTARPGFSVSEIDKKNSPQLTFLGNLSNSYTSPRFIT
jgi:hypothetical protein